TRRHGGKVLTDRLQNSAVTADPAGAPGAPQLDVERGATTMATTGEKLGVQGQVRPAGDPLPHRLDQPSRTAAVNRGTVGGRTDDPIQICPAALVAAYHVDPIGSQRADLVDECHPGTGA